MVFLYKKWRPRRSVLFMPASNRRVLEKAQTLPCDAVIFDLEDSVSEDQQDIARQNLLEMVRGQDFDERETIIRVSEPTNVNYSDDVDIAIACKPDAILVPKVEDQQYLQALAKKLDGGDGHDIALWAMVETPMALINLSDICSSTERLDCLVIGPNDLAKSTGTAMISGRNNVLPWLMDILAHGRAYGHCVLDGVYNQFRDEIGFKKECEQGAQLGFDGKTLIHPMQIESANQFFSPSKAEIENSKAIVAAFENPKNRGKAALQINGEMFEELHFDSARQLLAMAAKY